MDRRYVAGARYSPFTFDEKTMTIRFEFEAEDDDVEVTVPAKFEVCGTCDGKGTHVNPNIDHQGITPEEFDEDPRFREDYFAGHYDVPCNECHGRRVVPTIDEDHADPELVNAYRDLERSMWDEARWDVRCREMGY